jgi:hypothetical protein
MTIEQVLVIVRALFAAQIDREPNDLREWLLRQIVAALAFETQVDAVRVALRAASHSEDEAMAARARRALLALDALDALDAMLADEREARFAARADSDDALRRPSTDDGDTRRREAAGK